jgi:hypothetical protein
MYLTLEIPSYVRHHSSLKHERRTRSNKPPKGKKKVAFQNPWKSDAGLRTIGLFVSCALHVQLAACSSSTCISQGRRRRVSQICVCVGCMSHACVTKLSKRPRYHLPAFLFFTDFEVAGWEIFFSSCLLIDLLNNNSLCFSLHTMAQAQAVWLGTGTRSRRRDLVCKDAQ